MQIADKIEQVPPSRSRQLPGVGVQRQQIAAPLRTTLHGPEHRQCLPVRIQLPQQPIRRQLPGRRPQLRQPLQKGTAILAVVGTQSAVVVSPRMPAPDLGQPIRRKAQQRRPQHRQQRHILPWIVHDLQKRHHHGDLHGLEEGLLLPAGAGDILPLQSRREGLPPCRWRAHQDHDILRLNRALLPVLPLHGEALVQQLPDAMSHEPGLHLRPVEAFLLRIRHADQMELRIRVAALRIACGPVVQSFLRPVVHLPHLPGHDAAKHKVGSRKHLPPGAEVLAQQHLSWLPLLRLLCRSVGQIFLQKNGGVRQPEPIDALLHIPHGEQVLPVP